MPEVILIIVFGILLLPGILFAFIPVLPALPYMFLVVLGYGLFDKFENLTPTHLLILGGLALFSLLVGYLAGFLGARVGGASKKSLLYGLVGAVIGTFWFPPLGTIIGLFVGVLIGELTQLKGHLQAFRAATFSLAGTLIGIAVNLLLAIAIIVLFIVFVI